MPLIFSFGMMCVTHPASCLAGLLTPSGNGGLFMALLKGRIALHPSRPYSLFQDCFRKTCFRQRCWILCLVVKLQHHVLGQGREQDPRYPSKQSCGTRPGHCHLPFHYLLKEVNELGKQKEKVESLASTLNNSMT